MQFMLCDSERQITSGSASEIKAVIASLYNQVQALDYSFATKTVSQANAW